MQVPHVGDTWLTVARHHPRRRFDRFVVDSLGSATVRLLFAGEHHLRFVGRVSKSGALMPQRLSLASARHSRLGDVAPAIETRSGTTATLAGGDALVLDFAAPPLASSQVRDWFLLTRGTRVTQSGQFRAERAPGAEALPADLALHQNQPNPFAASTTFRYSLPRATTVRLEIFDLVGRRLATVVDGWTPAGDHAIAWDSRDGSGAPLRPGAYLYRLTAGGYRAEKKLVVIP